jgi:hypothetical protein
MRAFSLALLCVVVSSSMGNAQEILGKQLSFTTPYGTTLIAVLNDGHILITDEGKNCEHSEGGQTGGEAFIDKPLTRSFSCRVKGVGPGYHLRSSASFLRRVLRIKQIWKVSFSGKTSSTTQTTVLTINGASCSGTHDGDSVVHCTVK